MIWNRDLFTDNHVCTEDFIQVLLAGHFISVSAHVTCIISKVDALTKYQMLVRVVNVKAILSVNYPRISFTRPVPKSETFGCQTSHHCHVFDLLSVMRPELEILDGFNLNNLCVIRSLLIEQSGHIVPQLACLIDLAYFQVLLLTVLNKRVFPFVRIIHPQEFSQLDAYPQLNLLLLVLA